MDARASWSDNGSKPTCSVGKSHRVELVRIEIISVSWTEIHRTSFDIESGTTSEYPIRTHPQPESTDIEKHCSHSLAIKILTNWKCN